ncbi:MAG: RluA family pseudouridine synthase [Acidobacteriales bacterium]|nr:RluA family pseudouridine synthase [Terriglobales bacterium]
MSSASKSPVQLCPAHEDAGQRLDRYLAAQLPDLSRARLQQMIEAGEVLVNEAAAKASLKLRGGEQIMVHDSVRAPLFHATAEDIALDVVYDDDDLGVINKPAGMMVHAGAGATDEARNRGTLVNALLHRFRNLSGVGGEFRPGIVHRLDRGTSGLILIAKNDVAHGRLAQAFARREVHKTYIALVHGWLKNSKGTVSTPISRDPVHRTRMTARTKEGRAAISHYQVDKQIDSPLGRFSLVEVRIETGRTHQIRVHLSSLGHPVVGDTLYGAPKLLGSRRPTEPTLSRNFLHAKTLEFRHPTTGELLTFSRPVPPELSGFLEKVERIIEKK